MIEQIDQGSQSVRADSFQEIEDQVQDNSLLRDQFENETMIKMTINRVSLYSEQIEIKISQIKQSVSEDHGKPFLSGIFQLNQPDSEQREVIQSNVQEIANEIEDQIQEQPASLPVIRRRLIEPEELKMPFGSNA